MPIFEYKCTKCGRISDFLEGLSGNPERQCPYCKSKKLEKQFSVFAAQVKEGQSKKCHGCSDMKCPHAVR